MGLLYSKWKLLIACCFILLCFSYSTCKYGFKDTAPIPPEVKTFRVNPLTNRAQYVNPQLAPQITEKLKQKIINTTRLRQTNSDDAHYDISGNVSQYYTSTTGITGTNASTNRLNISFHLIFKNTLDEKKNFEADVSTYVDFPASQSLAQAEAGNLTKIVGNIVDEIFNKIFANW
ncbi:LPS assembly lipoprotein LptE [Ferruginibacter sp.]